MERADHRAAEPDQRAQARARHRGLVEVHEVGLDAAHHFGRPPRGRATGRDRRDRAVGVPLDARPDRHDARLGRRSVARADDPHVDAELAQTRASPSTWPCTPPGREREYGDVITTRTTSPLVASHSALPRSLGQFGCNKCHCSGAARISSSSSTRELLGDPRDVVAQATPSAPPRSAAGPPRGGHGRAKVDRGGHQCRPGAQRERRRAARQARPLAEEVDLDPVALDVAIGEQAHDPVVAQRPRAPRATRRGRAAPRRSRSRPAARRTTPSSSGGSIRSTTAISRWPRNAIQAPPHSHPPRCGQREDHALAAREAGLDVLEALDREVRGHRAGPHLGRQPEHLEPVAAVRVEAHPRHRTGPRAASGPGTARR